MSIFVVDDEPLIAGTTAEILKRHGYPSVSFIDPHKALDAVKCECPRLLIADIKMPGMSGIELAILTRVLCQDCGIILFTGHISVSGLLDVPAGRGFSFLFKPAAPEELLFAVARIIGPAATR